MHLGPIGCLAEELALNSVEVTILKVGRGPVEGTRGNGISLVNSFRFD